MNTIISAKSSKSEKFQGASTQRDFQKYGYITLEFYIHDKFIGVDVNGFSSSIGYTYEPKTKSQISKNQYFIERYVNNVDDIDDLKIKLNLKNQTTK